MERCFNKSRGAVCVFPQNEENPFWIPERLTRRIMDTELEKRTTDSADVDLDRYNGEAGPGTGKIELTTNEPSPGL